MKIFILTQEEPFYLPVFFQRLFRQMPVGIEVAGVCAFPPFNSQDSWKGVILDHLGYYGPSAFVRQGFRFVGYKVLDILGGRKDRPYSVEAACLKFAVPIHEFPQVNQADFQEFLRREGVDLLVSVACPQILGKKTLSLLPKGGINLHSAKLPHYRGIAPLFWAMLHGEKEVAVSIHEMTPKIDQGALLAQEPFPIKPRDSLDDLYQRLISIGPPLLAQVLDDMAKGRSQPLPQPQGEGSYFGFPGAEAGKEFRKKGLRFF